MLRSLTVAETSLGPGPTVGLKAWAQTGKISASEASPAMPGEGKDPFCPQNTSRLASLTDFFFPFSPNAEPGRRLAAKLRVHVVPSYLGCNYVCMYLADFLKTNVTKCPVISVKRRQKAAFLSPIMSKITVTKDKERRKREEKTKKQWLHS